MKLTTTNILLLILGCVMILCLILMLLHKTNTHESFVDSDPVIDAIQSRLSSESPEELQKTVKMLQQRLIDYGYAPQLDSYVKKTELGIDGGKCIVDKAADRDKYISKSDIPAPGPRIDLSQYVKKSSIPPEKVCPPTPEIDYSQYVKKSTLPPNQQCPPCIAPKVKVSAGLCRECPPAPSCPAPQPCPQLKCPEPAPCVQKECPKCDEIRYIKVPSLITKTITVDKNGSVLSQKIDSGIIEEELIEKEPITYQINNNDNYNNYNNDNNAISKSLSTPANTEPKPTVNTINNQRNNEDARYRMSQLNNTMVSNTEPLPAPIPSIPDTTFPQKGCGLFGEGAELNSEFKKFGIYGIP
jgi:hypothetical protein